MSDAELAALRRRVELAPEDGELRLELAAALLRSGERDEALAALWRARASGALADAAAPLARALEAPASPWAHSSGGDVATPGTSRLRGPRRGEIVARAPLEGAQGGALVLLGDGTVVVRLFAPEERLLALEGRTLAPLGEWARLQGWRRGLLALEEGGLAFAADGELVALPAAGARRSWPTPGFEHPELLAGPGGRLVLLEGRRLASLGPDREQELELELPPSAAVQDATLMGGQLAIAFQQEERLELAWVDLHSPSPVLRVAGARLFLGRRGKLVSQLVSAPGRLLLVTACHLGWEWSYTLHEVGPEGERWQRHAGEIEDLGGAPWLHPALGPGGDLWLAGLGQLARHDRGGNEVWSRPIAWGWWSVGLVLDREGAAYAAAPGGLTAWGPDGAELFRVPGDLRPCAIDARGRLLAVRADSRRLHELVAIE